MIPRGTCSPSISTLPTRCLSGRNESALIEAEYLNKQWLIGIIVPRRCSTRRQLSMDERRVRIRSVLPATAFRRQEFVELLAHRLKLRRRICSVGAQCLQSILPFVLISRIV